jgi:hypothetical protein
MRHANSNGSYVDLKKQIISEYAGKPVPDTAFLTIPEYDNIAPEEDWTAGLPIVLRGIQNDDWNDVAHGIVISLEQVENYPIQSGREDDPTKDWRDRTRRIAGAEEKGVEKWLPEDLMAMAKRHTGS